MNDEDFDKLTNSAYVNNKYREFYQKHGRMPKYFQPYNGAEGGEICTTISTCVGSPSGIGAVLITEESDGQ